MTETASELVVLDGARVWKGYRAIEPLLVPADSIHAHPRNPRKGSLGVIARSLSDFGQTKPIIVQASTGWIVAGNHTLRAATELLHWTHIAAVRADLSDDDALAYLLADNRSSDLGGYDEEGLVEILGELAERDRLDSTGYAADDLDDLIASSAARRDAAAEFAGSGDGDDPPPPPPLPGGEMREFVLMLTPKRHAAFVRQAKMLQREWKTDGASETIAEAIERAAKAL